LTKSGNSLILIDILLSQNLFTLYYSNKNAIEEQWLLRCHVMWPDRRFTGVLVECSAFILLFDPEDLGSTFL
jgi:hypothetical protein